jgi:pimeloyl-ACP methyl ester carboxylesterase
MPGPLEGVTRVGRASVHWRREGSGPALVLLHGFPLSGRTWDPIVARLRDRFTCWAPDLIGLGESHSEVDEDYASPGQARVFHEVLAQLGVESYALVGNDTGGWIARELALLDRARVTRLVLTNTEIPFHRPPWIPMYQALARVPGYGSVMRLLLRSRALRRSPLVFGGCFDDLSHLDGEFHRHFVEPLVSSDARIQGALRFLRQMKFERLDEFQRLHGELAIPTLFVWAANDPTFPIARAREMAKQFPNATGFHEIRNAKLFCYAEQPDEVARLIAAALSNAP